MFETNFISAYVNFGLCIMSLSLFGKIDNQKSQQQDFSSFKQLILVLYKVKLIIVTMWFCLVTWTYGPSYNIMDMRWIMKQISNFRN